MRSSDPLGSKSVEDAVRGGLTRGDFMRRGVAGVGVLSLPALLAACGDDGGGGGSAAAGLTFSGFGGTTQEAIKATLTDPFAKAKDVPVKQGGPTDYGQMKAMVAANRPRWDVGEVDGQWLGVGVEQGLLEPLNYDKIPQSANIPEERVDPHGVGFFSFSTVMAWDTTRQKRGPESWADFYDLERYPGKRGFQKGLIASGLIESALLADGVPKDQLYPLDFDRALAKLDTIKESIVWWTTYAESQQFMTQGTVAYNAALNGRMFALIQKGLKIHLEWNENIQSSDYLVVLKGSENKDRAMELIDWMISPEPQARFAEATSFAPLNAKAVDLVKGDVADYLSTSPEHLESAVLVDSAYWAKTLDSAQEQFDAWVVQ